jgi:hypothetical protein
MNPKDYKLVQVTWNDAGSHDSWVSLKDIVEDKSMECISVGWLVSDRPDRLVLVASMDLQTDQELVSGHVTIPKAVITDIRELSIKRVKQKKQESLDP